MVKSGIFGSGKVLQSAMDDNFQEIPQPSNLQTIIHNNLHGKDEEPTKATNRIRYTNVRSEAQVGIVHSGLLANSEYKKEDCVAFPVLNSNIHPTVKAEIPKVEEEDITHVRTRRNSSEAFGSPILEKGKKSFSLERKLTMLNWDGVTPRSENIDMIGEHNDAGSDASSDLFELESFSTNGNNAFLTRQVSNGRSSNATLPNGYAPSESIIAWSGRD
ncbi:phytochrome kinase substrate 1-like protein [Tanacetum coccineum]